MPGPASNLLSRTDASAMAQFSMELRELEAVSLISNLNQVPETQLDTQAIMHELSVDSEVTFCKVLGSAEILPTRPGIDPFEDTRPMDTSSDRSSLQLTPITSTSPSVIATCMPPGLAISHHTMTPQTLHISLRHGDLAPPWLQLCRQTFFKLLLLQFLANSQETCHT